MFRLDDEPDKLMKELLEEREKAIFWFLKRIHGIGNLPRARKRLMLHSEEIREGCHTYIEEFKSTNGNTWAVYIGLEYVRSLNRRFFQDITMSLSIEGNDITMICPVVIPGEEPVALIYTPSFFHSYREVKGLTEQKGALLGMFTRDLRMAPYHLKEEGQVEIYLHEGVARGFVKHDKPKVLQLDAYVLSPTGTSGDADARDLRLFDLDQGASRLRQPEKPKGASLSVKGPVNRMRFVQLLGQCMEGFFQRFGFLQMNGQRAMLVDPAYYMAGSDRIYQELARTKQVDVDHLVDFFTSMGQRAGLPPVDTARTHEVVVEIWKVYMS